jgi:hypothetical protein
MKVQDFKNGISVFIGTLSLGLGTLFVVFYILEGPRSGELFFYTKWILNALVVLLAVKGFMVNYIPLSVKNGIISIPANDQIRSFLDLIIVNPLTGLYRRRTYNANDINNVANGYTNTDKNKGRSWNVVITGIQNGKTFSQRLDVSNKQVRDEVRNVLKKTISGKVSSELSY